MIVDENHFLSRMHGDFRRAAELLWELLDRTQAAYMWDDWFRLAYESQARDNSNDEWLRLQRRLWSLLPELSELTDFADGPDGNTWPQLVPFVGGGWLMTLMDQPKMELIKEEP